MLSRVSLARLAARPTNMAGRRSLYVHEYAAKDLMGKYKVDYQRGSVVSTAGEVSQAWNAVDTKLKVIKAQILAGGRGKGTFIDGYKKGVQITDDAKKAQEIVGRMLGNKLRTAQTRGGPDGEGVPVNKVFIAECLDIQKEYYFAIVLEGKAQGAVMVGSAEGGVEIEEVQKKNPSAIITQKISWNDGLSFDDAKKFAQKIGFQGKYVDKAADSMVKLYKLMIESDATQVEINPFAETPDGRVVCIDAKINFDDNASHRQKSIFALRDPTQDDPKEVEAEKFNLNYVALDGNIACLVNGAGLAMSTMDMIKMYGAEPANFLDVGGSATKEAVSHAFKIITSDPRVKGILVNIFGGIMKCDVIAEGIVAAAKDIEIKVPLVVRLAGTNQEKGSAIIESSGLAITAATDLDDAAKKIVALSKKQ